MIAANVLSKEEFPDFDDETGILPKVDDEEGKKFIVFHLTQTRQSNSSGPVGAPRTAPDLSMSARRVLYLSFPNLDREWTAC